MHVQKIVKNKYTVVLITSLRMLYYHIGLLWPLSQLQHDKEIIKRLGHALERERKHCSDYVLRMLL